MVLLVPGPSSNGLSDVPRQRTAIRLLARHRRPVHRLGHCPLVRPSAAAIAPVPRLARRDLVPSLLDPWIFDSVAAGVDAVWVSEAGVVVHEEC